MEDTRERWRPFPLDSRYAVSTHGRVRRRQNRRIRKTPIKQCGYRGLVFTYPGAKPKGYDLHAMVALTWIGSRPPGHDVSHQDGDKLNNHLSNLKYETRRENANKPFNKYSSGPRLKLTYSDIRAIRADDNSSNNTWARTLGVCRATIWKARTGRTWRHID